MATSNIVLNGSSTEETARILQLYTHLELYRLGEPPANTLFVLGRPPLAVLAAESADQLLLIDPPADARQRFRLPANVATLFTGAALETGLPQVQSVDGGVAHIRIGEHLLDIYTQRIGNVVHLPGLGILCGGVFGSDALLPRLAHGSDGGEELDALRLLARLAKGSRLQLYIPSVGSLAEHAAEVLRRLANDVAYLHNLRRVAPALVKRGDQPENFSTVVDSLLPADRRSAVNQAIHTANLRTLMGRDRS